MTRRGTSSVLGLVLACGPSVAIPPDSEGSATGSGPAASGTTDVGSASATTAGPTATTTTSTTTSDADETAFPATEDEGVLFTVRPDYGPQLPTTCSRLHQDCPSGFKCMPWSVDDSEQWNFRSCFPVTRDPAQVGEACSVQDSPYSGLDDCAIGLVCWNVGKDNTGVCEDMCFGDSLMCADPSEQCVAGYDASVVLCVTACDPLSPTCPQGEGCYPAEQGWGCFLDDPALGGVHGDHCQLYAANGCDPGYACAADSRFTVCEDTSGCCTPVCDLDDPDSDAACAALDPAQTCEPWFAAPAPEGYEHVGVCTIPQ